MGHVVPKHAIVDDNLREVVILLPDATIVTLLETSIICLSRFKEVDDLSRGIELDVAIGALRGRVLIEIDDDIIWIVLEILRTQNRSYEGEINIQTLSEREGKMIQIDDDVDRIV